MACNQKLMTDSCSSPFLLRLSPIIFTNLCHIHIILQFAKLLNFGLVRLQSLKDISHIHTHTKYFYANELIKYFSVRSLMKPLQTWYERIRHLIVTHSQVIVCLQPQIHHRAHTFFFIETKFEYIGDRKKCATKMCVWMEIRVFIFSVLVISQTFNSFHVSRLARHPCTIWFFSLSISLSQRHKTKSFFYRC